MRFRLVPKSSTLDDLEQVELLYVRTFKFSRNFCASWHVWEATTAKRFLCAWASSLLLN